VKRQQALCNGKPCGTLRLGTLESTAAACLPPILARFHSACPDVQMDLVTGTSGALVGCVLSYEIEAAFVAEPCATANLPSLHVFTEELVLIASRSAGIIGSPKDLGTRTVIAFSQGCSYRRILEAPRPLFAGARSAAARTAGPGGRRRRRGNRNRGVPFAQQA
jgi:DNA-binding transcriptional LysR family regulator